MSIIKAYPQTDSSPADARSITSTDSGSKVGLDVAIISGSVTITGSVTVTATDLDIRDLSHTQDSVSIGDGTSLVTLGQKAMASSFPVVIASDQSSISVDDGSGSLTVDGTVASTQSGTWNINNITGTVSLPTGAATAANQLPDGHNVTVDNASGGSAVNIQDGGNVISVDDAGATLSIDDGGSSLTIDGTVTADQGTKLGSGSGWRVTEYGHTAGLPNFYANIASVFEVPGTVIVDPVTGTTVGVVSVNATGRLSITGDAAHGVTDANANPVVKVGSLAVDYEPDTDAEQGSTEVTASQRAQNAVNLRGEQIEGVNSRYHVLSNISTTYNNTTTTATSDEVECWNYRYACFSFEMTKANTPTDITIEVETSLDGTNFSKQMNAALGAWIYDDTVVGSGGIERNYIFPIAAQIIRIKVTATGTSASNTFTLTNGQLYLRN